RPRQHGGPVPSGTYPPRSGAARLRPAYHVFVRANDSPSTSTVSVAHRTRRGIDVATTAWLPPSCSRVPVRVVGHGQMHNSRATRWPSIQSDRVLNHLFRTSSTACPLYVPPYGSPVSAMTVPSRSVGADPPGNHPCPQLPHWAERPGH